MTKRGALSGWQLTSRKMQRKEIVPAMPTRWDRFCYANRIDDPLEALSNGKRKLVRDWVLRHYNNSFVPEKVLEELQIETRWIS